MRSVAFADDAFEDRRIEARDPAEERPHDVRRSAADLHRGSGQLSSPLNVTPDVRSCIVLLLMLAGCSAGSPTHPARLKIPAHIVVAGDSLAHGQGDESGLSLAQHLDRALACLGIAHEATIDVAISGSRTGNLARV